MASNTLDLGFASPGSVLEAAIKCCPGEADMLSYAVTQGASVNTFDQGQGQSLRDSPPLVEAVNGLNFAAIQFLLQHDADPNQCTLSSEMTALHSACLNVYLPIATLLLQHGASVDMPYKYNKWNQLTPLHCLFGLRYWHYKRNDQKTQADRAVLLRCLCLVLRSSLNWCRAGYYSTRGQMRRE